MEQAQEVEMDSLVSFKSGKILTITGIQNRVCTPNQTINLLASSNRYGYVFYATESDGLALIPSTYIDQECRSLAKSSEDDDDDPSDEQGKGSSIIYRSFIPGQLSNRNLSIIPYWIALNADESILACVLQQVDTHSWLILLYDVAKFIQMPDSSPLCHPLRLQADAIRYFAWNPAIPTRFIYLDGRGAVGSYEIDLTAGQANLIGQSQPDGDNSSICWSPQGKQFVIAKCDGALELYEPNLVSKKTYPSIINNSSFPPCINVLWISTRQFLLNFSDNTPGEDSFVQILVTFDKDQSCRAVLYSDLFFDAPDASQDTNSQYFHVRLNESKILFTGFSKSSKINVLGPNELNQDSLDIWTFDDQYRAIVKSGKNASNTQLILTGMALGLNSTLSITERNEKLPPCPILLLSNSHGVLQIYYYIQRNLPSICRAPETIKPSQTPSLPRIPSGQQPLSPYPPSNDPLQSILATRPSGSNGIPVIAFGVPPTSTVQPREVPNLGGFSFTTPGSVSTTSKSVINDISRVPNVTASIMSNSMQQTPTRTVTSNESSTAINPKIVQMVDQFQSKIKSIQQPISKPPEPPMNLDQSIADLTRTLQDMTTSIKQSMDSMKSMTKGHIEHLTKIENASHQIKLCQAENLYPHLKDRELDPWTQARLDSIKTRYDQVKHSFNVLLQFTHATIHDKSLSNNDEDGENEDFLPDFDISVNSTETMKRRIQNRLRELTHKVTEAEKQVENLCTRFKSNSLSSSTFTKTTMSSSSTPILHASDAQILSHLQTFHPKVVQIRVPPPVSANFSSSDEQKKQSTIEIIKPVTPTMQPSTPKSANTSTVESEGFKNMLRLVRTSIDLFSGVTSPEQLQELSNTIATSPLSSAQKSTVTPITKTPTISKTTSHLKGNTTTISSKTLPTGNASMNILQTPAKSVGAPVPIISVTPPTPASQGISSNASFQLQPNRSAVSTATDATKTQFTSGDNAIRSLLNNNVSPSTSAVNQPIVNAAPVQMTGKHPFFSNPSSVSTALTTSQSFIAPSTTTTAVFAPSSTPSSFGGSFHTASTAATSIQSISPTTKPIMSTGFGSKPIIGGIALNLTSTSPSTIPFGGTPTTATAGTAGFGGMSSSTASPLNAFFGAPASNISPATTSAPSTTTSSAPVIPIPIPTATTSAPTASPFGTFGTSAPTASPFGALTTSALTAAPFGVSTTSAPATNIFGSVIAPTSTSSTFGTSPASPASPFGSGFANTLTTTTSASNTGTIGGVFGGNITATSPFGTGFNTTATTSSASSSGSSFGAPSALSSGSTFGGFGGTGFGLNLTSSASSTIPTSTFGAGGNTGAFGSGFSGFGGQSNPSAPSTGFSFGGFGGPRSDSNAAPASFGSFGPPPAASQPPSPFGASLFGGGGGGAASPPPAAFGNTSSFGASSTQSTSSPSFTNYRK